LAQRRGDEEVEKWTGAETEQVEQIGASRNRLRCGILIERIERERRLRKSRSKRQAGRCSRTSDELTSRERALPKVGVTDPPWSFGGRYDDATIAWDKAGRACRVVMVMHADLLSYSVVQMLNEMSLRLRISKIFNPGGENSNYGVITILK
jgi:hypothetical protein